MTDWEIRQKYRLSKDKAKQIEILSDLTLLSRGDIATIVQFEPVADDGEVRMYDGISYKHYQDYMDVIIKQLIKNNNGYKQRKINRRENRSTYASNFTERLYEIIREYDLTKIEFANMIGVGKTTVYEWFSGNRLPVDKKVDMITERFGVTKEWLFSKDN